MNFQSKLAIDNPQILGNLPYENCCIYHGNYGKFNYNSPFQRLERFA